MRPGCAAAVLFPRKGDSDSAPNVPLNDGVKLTAAVSGLEQAMED